jgi:glutathione S-transferase
MLSAAPEPPTLYTTPLSANGRKPLAVARQLGVELRVRHVDVYRGEGRTPEYLAIHPAGRIPVLVDGPTTVFESNAILVYLAEAHGGDRLWSREPRERAAIARWLFWESAHWQPALIAVLAPFVGHRLRPDLVPAPPAAPDWDGAQLAPLLGELARVLAAQPFLAGAHLTLADFSVAGMATYFRAAGFPFAQHPAIRDWHARMEALPAWRDSEAELWRAP